MLDCENCGSPVREKDRFCKKCGSKQRSTHERKLTATVDDRLKRIASSPHDSGLHLDLGDLYLKNGMVKEALGQYLEAAEITPGSAEAWVRAGHALGGLERWDDAVKTYRDALSLDPGSSGATIGLVRALKALGKHEELLEVGWEAMEQGSRHPELLSALEIACKKMGLDNEATEVLRALVSSDPGDVNVRSRLAKFCEKTGYIQEAVHHHEQVLQHRPKDRASRLFLGRSAFCNGKHREVIEHLTSVVESPGPERDEAVCCVACSLLHLGDHDSAFGVMDGAYPVNLRGCEPEVRENVARTFRNEGERCVETGSPNRAELWVQAALALEPSEEGNELLARVYENQGDLATAEKRFKEAIAAYELAHQLEENNTNYRDKLKSTEDEIKLARRRVVVMVSAIAGGVIFIILSVLMLWSCVSCVYPAFID